MIDESEATAVEQADLSRRDAITQVLEGAQGAMHYSDIADAITQQKLRRNMGATPANTVNSIISVALNQEGTTSVFVRVKRGEYMLRSAYSQGVHVTSATQSINETVDETEEQVGIIRAFGMYWRRDVVRWTNNPLLQGQQNRGSQAVDFTSQKGVYLLHDGRQTVYVGRSVDRPLGRRLFEHTSDRLNGRWDRFSWFGLSEVTSVGKLVEQESYALDGSILIATLEALLIESIEPPLNRKRGDDFRAVEYLQVEDPHLQKRQLASLLDDLKGKLFE